MPTTAGDGIHPASVQRCHDVVNAKINTLNAAIDRHTRLISIGLLTAW